MSECRHELSVKYADDSSCSPGRIDWCPECGAIAVNGEWTRPAIVEAAQRDAQRLDHIANNARSDPKMDGNHVWWPTTFGHQLKGPTLRAAIDAAMKEKP